MMNDEKRAVFNSSFITPHSSFLLILLILSILVNYSFNKKAGRDKPCPYSLHAASRFSKGL
jgi:hypothetical protein